MRILPGESPFARGVRSHFEAEPSTLTQVVEARTGGALSGLGGSPARAGRLFLLHGAPPVCLRVKA